MPVKASMIGCGPVGYMTADTAFAKPPGSVPCPTPHAPSPWPAVAIIVGAGSVILNAIIVWNTQCRELTSQEAAASAFLPLVGIALDAQNNMCHR
jgi:hypothetical protein